MKCDTSKEQLIGYFYDEMPEDEKEKLADHLETCTSCQKELQGLGQMTKWLRAWPDTEPEIDLDFIREKTATAGARRRKTVAGKLAFGFATAAAAVLVLLSLINLEINYADGKLDMRMSLIPRSEVRAELPEDLVTRDELANLRSETYDYTRALLEESETRQRRQQRHLLTDFAREIEKQRQQDLRFVGRGLDAFQLANETRFHKTTEVLNQLIQASYVQSLQGPTEEQK